MNEKQAKEIYRLVKVIDNANRLIVDILKDTPKPEEKKIKKGIKLPKIKFKFKKEETPLLKCFNKECTHNKNEECTLKDLVVCEERVLE